MYAKGANEMRLLKEIASDLAFNPFIVGDPGSDEKRFGIISDLLIGKYPPLACCIWEGRELVVGDRIIGYTEFSEDQSVTLPEGKSFYPLKVSLLSVIPSYENLEKVINAVEEKRKNL